MTPFQVPNILNFKLFFRSKPNVISISFPNVKSNSSDGLEKMRDGNDSNYFKPLEKKPKILTKKVVFFRICELVNSHGLS
jgi:hypothetical protein